MHGDWVTARKGKGRHTILNILNCNSNQKLRKMVCFAGLTGECVKVRLDEKVRG